LAVIRNANRPAFGPDAIDSYGLGEILDRSLAEVAKSQGQLRGDVAMGGVGKADSAWLRQALEPRRQIDAVAIEVAILDDHVAEIDADAKLDLLALGESRIRRSHALLHIHGALYGVDHAGELDQHAIAHQFEDPAAMPGDQRSQNFAPTLLEDR